MAMTLRTGFLAVAMLLGGCAVSDYSTGISSFSKAVAAQDSAEGSLISSADAIRTNEWLDQVAKHLEAGLQIDLPKCAAVSGYKPRDCRVTMAALGSPPLPTASSTAALDRYAAALTSVATDTDCGTLSSDAALLSTSLTGLASSLHASASSELSPLVSLATIAGCRAVEAYRMKVLRAATAAADPVIQQLVAPIQHKDR